MPKKRNFLGGMQNYDPKTGEYEPDLRGANGERPSSFKNFKKDKSQHDKINEKRMGKKEQHGGIAGDLENLGFSMDVVDEENETLEFKGERGTYKIVQSKDNPANYETYLNDELVMRGQGGNYIADNIKKYDSDDDFVKKVKAKNEELNNNNQDVENGEEDNEFNKEIKETADKIRSSGDRYTYMMLDRLRSDAEYVIGNDSRGGMHQLWYDGDPKKHIALMKELHNGLKDKPEWLSMDKINELEKSLMELNEPIDEKSTKPKDLARRIKRENDIREVFGEYLNDKELSALANSRNLYVEISKQYNGADNYKIIDDKYIKEAFNNGRGTLEDLKKHIENNKENSYFIKIR